MKFRIQVYCQRLLLQNMLSVFNLLHQNLMASSLHYAHQKDRPKPLNLSKHIGDIGNAINCRAFPHFITSEGNRTDHLTGKPTNGWIATNRTRAF